MRITVMCGAGAMSTFVAHRLRGALARAGHTEHIITVSSVSDGVPPGTEVLLLGAHVPPDTPVTHQGGAPNQGGGSNQGGAPNQGSGPVPDQARARHLGQEQDTDSRMRVVRLPADIASDLDGSRTLALVDARSGPP